MKTIIWYIFIFALTSCSSYVPKKIAYDVDLPPDNQAAIVEIPAYKKMDYKVISYDGMRGGVDSIEKYYFLPGEHTITFGLANYGYTSNLITVTFNAKAGDRYMTSGWIDYNAKKWGVSLVDIKAEDVFEKNTTNVENRINLELH